jgi:hypothetical protein
MTWSENEPNYGLTPFLEGAKGRQVAIDRAWAIKDAADLHSYALRQREASERRQEEDRQAKEQARLAEI